MTPLHEWLEQQYPKLRRYAIRTAYNNVELGEEWAQEFVCKILAGDIKLEIRVGALKMCQLRLVDIARAHTLRALPLMDTMDHVIEGAWAPPSLDFIQVDQWIAQLTVVQQEVIRGVLNGESILSIAAQRKCTPAAVKQVYAWALKRLRTLAQAHASNGLSGDRGDGDELLSKSPGNHGRTPTPES